MVLLASLFVACSDKDAPKPGGALQPTPVQERLSVAPLQSAVTTPGIESAQPIRGHADNEAEAAASEAPVTSEATPAREEPDPAPRVLDLGYKSDVEPAQAEQGKAFAQDKKLLPDLFDQGKSAKKISVSGGVVLDHEQRELRELRESLAGGEVTVEIKTP